MKDRAYEIARNYKYDGYQTALASMVYTFFHKKTGSRAIAKTKVGVSLNEELAEDLHMPVIKKFKRWKVFVRFKDNVWAADLAEMGSLSSNSRNVKYLLQVIYLFIKHAWAKPLKDKIGKTMLLSKW